MLLISPTGMGIRRDHKGCGLYNASRGRRRHRGLDFLCRPGQDIISPIQDAHIVRVANPYSHSSLSGLVIENSYCEIRLFYLLPGERLLDQTVNIGDVIGTAQDITERYPDGGMLPHIHLDITRIDPHLFLREGISWNLF